ncbi:HAD family phosphatase [Arthrobacter sp. ISL-30]|uniref:HAD family hydrolase n=1 Tax=Arthrobacter sp. ISL-30 TaxID=2819109 RepID=UPI001BEB946F|nr:HAD family hydrolase [Arthrobacter sp. ISL-30]MBT2512237.1 haloacid dehalogenase-like hydrolase [Arthrobacter sp. ISL-30]
MRIHSPKLFAVVLLASVVSGCGSIQAPDAVKGSGKEGSTEGACVRLDPGLNWPAGVREHLQKVIEAHSACIGTVRDGEASVAIFDWDNTVVKNDIGYATNFWMLRNDKILQPENQDWKTTDRYLTDAAAVALSAACGTDIPAGEPLPTSKDQDCADEILAILNDTTRSGEAAFAGFDSRRLTGAYSWGTTLSAGYTAEELAFFGGEAKKQNLAAPEGEMQTVGTQEVDGYIRIYPQMKDLITVLQAHGVETWVVSASPEPVVKVWSQEVGIRADHVVGVRSVYQDGVQTTHLKGCGGVPDGDDSVMTYIDGKRCWANQEIFGIQGLAAFEQAPADRRQFLAAGDSVTDVTFVGDATAARIAVNRNKAELMCHAYDDVDGAWVVVPMFIDPAPRREEPYACSTTAYTNPDGIPGPVKRPDGTVIPDQADTIF